MDLLYLYIYLVLSVVHLYACFKGKEPLRFTTKPILMLILLLFYMTNTSNPSMYIIISLVLALYGDIYLMPLPDTFYVGAVCFFIADALYCYYFIINYLMNHLQIVISIYLVLIPIYAIFFFKPIKNYIGGLVPIKFLFFFALLLMNSISLTLMYIDFKPIYLYFFIGTALYYSSDYVLVRGTFYMPYKYQDFIVMSTYITAQMLIILVSLKI